MADFKIFVDSTADIDADLRNEFDIDYCPMNVSWGGEERVASLDWDQGVDPHTYYQTIRDGTRIFTTQVPVDVFDAKFKAALTEGKDILYIACSSKLSGSVNIGTTVAQRLLKEFPERKIVCYDPLISGYCQGCLAIDSSIARKNGATLEEVVEMLEKTKSLYNQVAVVETLTYLKNAGRVKASKAFFGNLFGVKPILCSAKNGQNVAYKKAKGRKASLDMLVEEALAFMDHPEDHIYCISQADDMASAEYVKKLLEEKVHMKGCFINTLGPIIGASCGPGTIIIAGFGKEKTVLGDC